MLSTSFADLDSPERLRAILAERGYTPEDAPADKLFDLNHELSQYMKGAKYIALVDPEDDDSTLVVLHVPRPNLTADLLRRIRRQLAENTRGGLIFCAENWQNATLYLLRQEDLPQAGQNQNDNKEIPEWKLNFHALRPADRQGLALLDLRGQDPYEVGLLLMRAFRRAKRTTIYNNQGLFSNYYLNERLEDDTDEHNKAWRDLSAKMDTLRQQIETALAAVSSGSDQKETEDKLIRPLLSALGWKLPAKSNKGKLELEHAGTGVALCHMLPFEAPLDLATQTSGSSTNQTLSPDLDLIGSLTSQKELLWGILTNGRTWRLISRQAVSTSGVFYEIDLRDLLDIGAADNRDLRWFAAFFGAEWLFTPPSQSNQPSLLGRVYQSGQLWAESVGEDLKKAIFRDVFVDFANALAEGERRSGRNPDLTLIYRATLVLLYRLLFVLYAESRHLLPLSHNEYYANSLTYLLSSLALKQNGLIDNPHDFSLHTSDSRLWDKLRALFAAIGTGRPEWHIPHYNGGLFADTSSPAHALLANLDQVANDYLTRALDQLARDPDARAAQDENGALRLIDYMDLNVRRLGSIYEGLLEFQLRQAPSDGEIVDGQFVPSSNKKSKKSARTVQQGELYLETTRQDRKASGSYYTPDYIVKYIVEQTVGPVLTERAKRFALHMDKIRTIETSLRRANSSTDHQLLRNQLDEQVTLAIDALLDIKVLDPAMGSGHFLVEAVNYLSDHIITILSNYPDNPLLKQLADVRQAVRANLRDQGIDEKAIGDEQLSDRVLLRRMVMKRCIYGVDLNEMAVDLAKLSLWLDSFAVGAPLSFLDHHLRWGNSLIGIWDIESDIHPSSAYWNDFIGALGYMVQVTKLSDSTSAQVDESKQNYEHAQKALRPFRERLNVRLANEFVKLGNPGQVAQAQRVARDVADEREGKHAPESIAKFDLAQAEASQRRFFHWKLEFPEVFVDPKQRDWKADGAAGFDAVVGNPPYVSAWSMTNLDRTLRTAIIKVLNLGELLTGHWDLYLAFVLKAYDWVTLNSRFAFIIPNPFCREKYAAEARGFLLINTTIASILSFGNKNVFDEVSRHTLVPVFTKYLPSEDSKVYIDSLSIDINGTSTINRNLIDQNAFLKLPGYQIIYDIEISSLNLRKKIEDISDKIGNVCYVNYGAQISSREKGKFRKEDVISLTPIGNAQKFFDGKSIDRYAITWDGRYVNYQPEQMYGPRSAELFNSKKIVIRDFTGEGLRLIVSYDDERLYCDHLIICLTHYSNLHGSGLQVAFEGYVPKSEPYPSLLFLTGILGTSLLSWFFSSFIATDSLQGTYSHTYPQQIRAFPYRLVHFTTPEEQRKQQLVKLKTIVDDLLSNKQALALQFSATGWPRYLGQEYRASALGQAIAALLPQDSDGNFVAFAEGASGAEEQSDVVHDLLAALAEQMIELNKQKQAEIKRFLGWLETQLDIGPDKQGRGGIDSLANKTTLQNYLGDYQKNEPAKTWDEINAVLHKNKKRFVNDYLLNDMSLPQLKAAYENSLKTLLPLKERLARTDALIDQIVYQLYGLRLEEIAVVEAA